MWLKMQDAGGPGARASWVSIIPFRSLVLPSAHASYTIIFVFENRANCLVDHLTIHDILFWSPNYKKFQLAP